MRKSLTENLEVEPISSTPEIRPIKEKATADALLLELAKRGPGSRKYCMRKM
jgi:hypothetical protein